MAAPGDRNKLRCAMDHIIEAEKNGEISTDNVIYIVENINVAGIYIYTKISYKLFDSSVI
jgi:trans-cinnamate 4-monooxygenase